LTGEISGKLSRFNRSNFNLLNLMDKLALSSLAGLLIDQAAAQSVLFDFDSAPAHTPFPISLTAGGINAQFSATGQGYSIQAANTLGFAPAGFSGNCVYPSSVFGADLLVAFSAPLTGFSILYAPEEYACDSSATMRVTAYLGGTMVGTATTNAVAGTWPSETLAFSSAQGFDNVVVHYDKAPVTGGDYGPVFMADNMAVTPAPAPPSILLAGVSLSSNGAFQFTFTNNPNTAFTVQVTTNLGVTTAGWSSASGLLESSPGVYTFTEAQSTNAGPRFYRIRWP
jgi:hypothetical protein